MSRRRRPRGRGVAVVRRPDYRHARALAARGCCEKADRRGYPLVCRGAVVPGAARPVRLAVSPGRVPLGVAPGQPLAFRACRPSSASGRWSPQGEPAPDSGPCPVRRRRSSCTTSPAPAAPCCRRRSTASSHWWGTGSWSSPARSTRPPCASSSQACPRTSSSQSRHRATPWRRSAWRPRCSSAATRTPCWARSRPTTSSRTPTPSEPASRQRSTWPRGGPVRREAGCRTSRRVHRQW